MTPPAIPTGYGGKRTPRLGDLVARNFVGQLVELVKVSQGGADAQIGVRENVQATQGENQEHLRRPNANPIHLDELLDHFVIAQSMELSEPHLAGLYFARQVQQISSLLTR